jgi:hypothetical protein
MSTLKNYKDQSVNLHCIRSIRSITTQQEKIQKPNSERPTSYNIFYKL